MVRFRHTLTLTAAAVAFTASGALASSGDTAPVVPHDPSMMATMHAGMGDHLDHHASMAGDPTMIEHMAGYGVGHGEMAAWIAEGLSLEEMHARLEDRGVDVDEMSRSCPMDGAMDGAMGGAMGGAREGSMAGMHTTAPGPSHADHHGGRTGPTG
jgi:hypothetical protein